MPGHYIGNGIQLKAYRQRATHKMTASEPKPEKPCRPLAYDAYQKLASAYAAKVDTKPHNAYYERPAMLSLLPNINGASVLNAGCGPGAYCEELAIRGASVASCDMSERMLELANERIDRAIAEGRVAFDQVKFHHLDLTQPLSLFDDGIFDLVNAPLCLDYIEDWTSLFREFNRTLKPGGMLLFSAGHPASDAEYFKTTKYFEVEQVAATWTGFGVTVEMPCFRRSLAEFFNPVANAGFVLDQVHEPLPTEDFQKSDLRRYMQLMYRPVFLCVRAIKPANNVKRNRTIA